MRGDLVDRLLTGLGVLVAAASVAFCGWVWTRTDGLLSLDLVPARLPWPERTGPRRRRTTPPGAGDAVAGSDGGPRPYDVRLGW